MVLIGEAFSPDKGYRLRGRFAGRTRRTPGLDRRFRRGIFDARGDGYLLRHGAFRCVIDRIVLTRDQRGFFGGTDARDEQDGPETYR